MRTFILQESRCPAASEQTYERERGVVDAAEVAAGDYVAEDGAKAAAVCYGSVTTIHFFSKRDIIH